MKNNLLTLLMLLLTKGFLAQSFEGEIVYSIKYTSKNTKMTDQQMNYLFGNWQSYHIKGANYKTTSNGKIVTWQLYRHKENRLYTKAPNTETIFWTDASRQEDEVLKAELNKGVVEVLGYKCDELVLTCKSGKQKYYYNSGLLIDADIYKQHKFGNWYEYVQRAKAIPLKSVIENAQFIQETTATEVKPKKMEEDYFNLPPNINIAPGP